MSPGQDAFVRLTSHPDPARRRLSLYGKNLPAEDAVVLLADEDLNAPAAT